MNDKGISLQELRKSKIIDWKGKQATLYAITKSIFIERSSKAMELAISTGDTSELISLHDETNELLNSFNEHRDYIQSQISIIEAPNFDPSKDELSPMPLTPSEIEQERKQKIIKDMSYITHMHYLLCPSDFPELT